MKALFLILALFLLVDLSLCQRKKKNKQAKSKSKKVEETCFIHGKTLKVGEKEYMEEKCGYCHCRGPQNVICDQTVS